VLTDAMLQSVVAQRRGTVATTGADGVPRRTTTDTLEIWDESTIVFADAGPQNAASDLLGNPSCAIEVVDPDTHNGFRFVGRARLLLSGPTFDRLLERYRARGLRMPVRHMVMVQVERAEEFTEA
jgi:predicted pyridoxine 5'-phosphate oxidase superfamily flavin-nucleotide-binding protein